MEIPTKPIPEDGIPRLMFGSDNLKAFRREHCDNRNRFIEQTLYYVIHPCLRGGKASDIKSLGMPGHSAPKVLEEFYLSEE